MIKSITVSPLNLHLDEKNPRFRINVNPTQPEIRKYLLDHEDAGILARRIVRMDTVMPGERIIVLDENGRKVVLEGNRRTTVYQMLLNRKLIPDNWKKRFPVVGERLLKELKKIPVDVVDNRQEAMAFLAARHIQGVKQWSSYSKWHVSFEMFQDGVSIDEIAERLPGSGDITRNIKSYKILLRVLNHSGWTQEEKKAIDPLTLKPDQLIRLFFIRDTVPGLGLRYNEEYTLSSTKMSDEKLDELLHLLARKAFLDKTIGTRTKFSDKEIQDIVAPFIGLKPDDQMPGYPEDDEATDENPQGDNVYPRNDADSDGPISPPKSAGATGEGGHQQQGNAPPEDVDNGQRRSKKVIQPYFFDGLAVDHLNRADTDAHGVIYIANELIEISRNRAAGRYPMSACFLTRAIIEHSLIYYAKKVKIQGSADLIYSRICRQNGSVIMLGDIIETYQRNLSNFISSPEIRQHFTFLFSDNQTKDVLNWVIHRPQLFRLPAERLIELPGLGLRCVIEYLLACT